MPATNLKKIKQTQLFWPYIPGLLAIAYYLFYLYGHALNMPKWDDMLDILYFMEMWTDASNINDKLQAFLYHTNDHILLVNHAIFLGYFSLFDNINFRHLIFIGNVFFLGSAFIFWLFFKNNPLKNYIFSLVFLCCINLASWESTFWAMTSISNQAVIFFSLSCLYFLLNKSRFYFFLAVCCFFLSVFSQSNGFITGLIGLALLYKQNKKIFHPRVLVWLFTQALVLLLYICIYDPAAKSDTGLIDQLPLFIPLLWKSIPGFLIYLGGTGFTVFTPFAIYFAGLTGFFICYLLWVKLGKIKATGLDCIYPFFFMALTALSVALLPTVVFGLEAALTSRYKMYAAYIFVIVLLLLFGIEGSESKKPVTTKTINKARWALVVALILNISTYLENHDIAQKTDDELVTSYLLWLEDGDIGRSSAYMIGNTDRYLFASEKKDYYSLYALVPDTMQGIDVEEENGCSFKNIAEDPPSVFSINHRRNAYAIVLDILQPFSSKEQLDAIYLCPVTRKNRLSYKLTVRPTLYTLNRNKEIITSYIHRDRIKTGNYHVFYSYSHAPNQFYADKNLFKNKVNVR